MPAVFAMPCVIAAQIFGGHAHHGQLRLGQISPVGGHHGGRHGTANREHEHGDQDQKVSAKRADHMAGIAQTRVWRQPVAGGCGIGDRRGLARGLSGALQDLGRHDAEARLEGA